MNRNIIPSDIQGAAIPKTPHHRQTINIYKIQILTSLNPLFHTFHAITSYPLSDIHIIIPFLCIILCAADAAAVLFVLVFLGNFFSSFFFSILRRIFLVWFSLDPLEKALVPLALER